MHSRDRTLVPAGLPAQAPLPSLTTAFSRRAALFGAVASTGFLAAGASAMSQGMTMTVIPSALDPADARLVALANAYEAVDRQVNATLSTAPGYGDLVDAYFTIEKELADTPAETMVGVLAKARVMQFSACRDCNGADIGGSIADDIVRLHAAGVL